MMKRFLILNLLIGLVPLAKAEVDPKIHNMCLQAQDYLGCVKAQTTKPTEIQNLRLIQGQTELTGNSCPQGYGYSGAGYCTNVICADRWMFKPHPDLKDKAWKGCVFLQPSWGRKVIKAVVDPKCPDKEPIIGTPSSCTTQEELDKIKAEKKSKKDKKESKPKKPIKINCDSPVWKNKPICN